MFARCQTRPLLVPLDARVARGSFPRVFLRQGIYIYGKDIAAEYRRVLIRRFVSGSALRGALSARFRDTETPRRTSALERSNFNRRALATVFRREAGSFERL